MWPDVEACVLTAPAMGARFAEYFLAMTGGQGTKSAADGRIETFLFVLTGEFRLRIEDDAPRPLKSGAYALVGPHTDFEVRTVSNGALLMVRKAYEPISGVAPPRSVIGDQTNVSAEPFQGDEGARLQTLLPDELAFDLAMNIFTFEPGHSLPVVETHVMEHGLYFLQGKGMYYLDNEWMEVEAGDFIWMGPFVPQAFYATGPIPAKYIYYKNVNRDVAL